VLELRIACGRGLAVAADRRASEQAGDTRDRAISQCITSAERMLKAVHFRPPEVPDPHGDHRQSGYPRPPGCRCRAARASPSHGPKRPPPHRATQHLVNSAAHRSPTPSKASCDSTASKGPDPSRRPPEAVALVAGPSCGASPRSSIQSIPRSHSRRRPRARRGRGGVASLGSSDGAGGGVGWLSLASRRSMTLESR
jgi:hypothetical protein